VRYCNSDSKSMKITQLGKSLTNEEHAVHTVVLSENERNVRCGRHLLLSGPTMKEGFQEPRVRGRLCRLILDHGMGLCCLSYIRKFVMTCMAVTDEQTRRAQRQRGDCPGGHGVLWRKRRRDSWCRQKRVLRGLKMSVGQASSTSGR